MGRSEAEKVTVVEQGVYPVPDIPIKDLLDSIPSVLSPYCHIMYFSLIFFL
jgi:hypothetical protein